MGNSDSIDFSLSNLYRSWYAFRRGKHSSSEIIKFQYYLEPNLKQLHSELLNRSYQHGPYEYFVVQDSKRRDIAVAPVRDRIVHRLLYDYLLPIWDKSFIFDAWSCRPNKGLHRAVNRTADFMRRHPQYLLWRADITKFFDSVDQTVLTEMLQRRVSCKDVLWLTDVILSSYSRGNDKLGMPIGNLTSQILANIYLNEFDLYVTHCLKPEIYIRYGDDWLCFAKDADELQDIKSQATSFLSERLKLTVNPKLDFVRPAYKGVTYLGIDIWPTGQRINRQTEARIKQKIKEQNFYSYEGMMRKFANERQLKQFYWRTLEL